MISTKEYRIYDKKEVKVMIVLEENMLLQWFFYILCCQIIFVTHKNWQ